MSDPSRPAPAAGDLVTADTRDRLRPFRRIDIPPTHLPPRSDDSTRSPITGRGYDCGCRAATDYDGKIGEDIADDLTRVLKVLTGLEAIDKAKDVLANFLGGIPIIGPALKQGIQKFFDDKDPLKNLMRKLGRALDALLVDSIIRGVPSWVPAYRVLPREADHLEQELEGRIVRSRQRYDSIPFTQWHLHYDWSFRVAPVPEFLRLMGDGNTGRERNDGSLEQAEAVGRTRYDTDTAIARGANINATVDCEWDLGTIGEPPAPFLNELGTDVPRDWMWPMTGAHFWAAGRCVYDCSHATSDEKQGNDPGLHLNQLYPCKAIATARSEGVKFDDNPLAVPAAQFMFFASRTQAKVHDKDDPTRDRRISTAGDFRFPALNDSDYTFLVDLPPAPPRDGPFFIGATPGVLLNTLVPGRPLLHRFDVQNFATAHDFANNGGVLPELEAVRPKEGGLPTQVKVTIPLTKLSPQVETYGVIISLGWFDPAGTLATRVRKVTIELTQIAVADRHETGRPEFRVNVAVNGRWFFFKGEEEVERNGTITLKAAERGLQSPPRTLTLFLADDDAISISVHGMEQDGLGDIMDMPPDRQHPPVPDQALSAGLRILTENFLNDRLLRGPKRIKVGVPGSGQPPEQVDVPFVGRPVEWSRDVDQRDITPGADNKEKDRVASIVARAMFLRMAMQGFDANDLLGLIDPNVRFPEQKFGRLNDDADTPNPLTVAQVIADVGLGRFKECRLSAYETDAMGRMGNLSYDPKKLDYVIRYRVRVDPQ